MAPHLFALAAAALLLLAAPCLALHSSLYDNLLSKAQVCLLATSPPPPPPAAAAAAAAARRLPLPPHSVTYCCS